MHICIRIYKHTHIHAYIYTYTCIYIYIYAYKELTHTFCRLTQFEYYSAANIYGFTEILHTFFLTRTLCILQCSKLQIDWALQSRLLASHR